MNFNEIHEDVGVNGEIMHSPLSFLAITVNWSIQNPVIPSVVVSPPAHADVSVQGSEFSVPELFC